MTMNNLPWLLVLALVAGLTSCTTSPEDIKIGTPKDDVVKTLGRPTSWYIAKGPLTSAGPSDFRVASVFSVEAILAQDMPRDEVWLFEYKADKGKTTSIILRDGKVFSVSTEGGKQ